MTSATASELVNAVRQKSSNRITRAEWISISSAALDESCAVATWETFITHAQVLAKHKVSDWIEAGTLCILLLLQTYKPRRHRILSELWEDTSAVSSPRSPRVHHSPRSPSQKGRSNDDRDKIAFFKENILSFVTILCD